MSKKEQGMAALAKFLRTAKESNRLRVEEDGGRQMLLIHCQNENMAEAELNKLVTDMGSTRDRNPSDPNQYRHEHLFYNLKTEEGQWYIGISLEKAADRSKLPDEFFRDIPGCPADFGASVGFSR